MISNLILILAIALVFALVALLCEGSAFWKRLRELDPKTWEELGRPSIWRQVFSSSLKNHVQLQVQQHYFAEGGEYRKHKDKKLTSIEARQKALLFLVLAIMLLLFMVLLLWAVGPA
jgi:hypothetical protein